MKKRGKIKFSHKKGNRGQKTQYFRVVADSLDPQGDWKNHPSFPDPMYEMKCYFPFSKMDNNILIGYSGFTQLPSGPERGAPLKSYFVVADGIGEPLLALPDGHNGYEWDGRKDPNLILTEERLAKMQMVKKRMTMILCPDGWAPHEYVTWSTTSQMAIDFAIADYVSMSELAGGDLSLIPFTFRAVDKTLKRRDGQIAKFTIGTIGGHGDIFTMAETMERVKKLRKTFSTKGLEEAFELEGFFYKSEEGDEIEEPVEPAVINEETGEVLKPATVSPKEIARLALQPHLSKAQVEKVLKIAGTLNRFEECANVRSQSDAMRLMNMLATASSIAQKAS